MGAEYADRLAGLDQQGLVVFQSAQRGDDGVETFPIARGAADAAIDDQLLRSLGDIGVQIVHQHAQRRLGQPAFGCALGAGGGADDAAIVQTGHW